jgi:hypothetical protein
MTMGVVRALLFFMALFCGFILGTWFDVHARLAECPPVAAVATSAEATVVDVARGVEVGMLARIVQIAADERIVAVDDQPVENDIAAGAAIAHRTLGANTYLDLTVASARGKRRLLVLMH